MPAFDHDDVTGYAKSEAEIREWILDGRPKRRGDAPDGEPAPLLRMPAWRGRLTRAEVDALVAWVEAVSDFDAGAAAGVGSAATPRRRLGLLRLPRPAGPRRHAEPGLAEGLRPVVERGGLPELARDDREIREWIRDGAPAAAAREPGGRVLPPAAGDPHAGLRRQGHRETRSAQVTAYIRWLRREGPIPAR